MTATDRDYYVRRACEEREREKSATTPPAAKAHAAMAAEYERMLAEAEVEACSGAAPNG